jgi:lysozyme
MTTTFGGTKLLEYPMPRVTSPVSFMNLENLSSGEGLASALRFAPQATMITQDTLDRQDSVLGIDISHHNGVADWKKAKAAGVEVGFIKLTQSTNFYSGTKYDITRQINGAASNNVPMSYYHFAVFGETSNPATDGVNQANYFVSKLNLFTKSKLPAVLDLEDGKYAFPPDNYNWSNRTEDINIFVKSFTDTMSVNGYKTMLYVPDEFVLEHGIKNQDGLDLWTPAYFNPNNKNRNAEVSDPPLPIGWVDWDIWQFSSQGIVDGVPPAGIHPGAVGVDLNMVKKDFLKKYNA